VSDSVSAISEPNLQERFGSLRTTYASREDLISELENFVRAAPDTQIVRINPTQSSMQPITGAMRRMSSTCFCMRPKRAC